MVTVLFIHLYQSHCVETFDLKKSWTILVKTHPLEDLFFILNLRYSKYLQNIKKIDCAFSKEVKSIYVFSLVFVNK